jgi:hypothetical protein
MSEHTFNARMPQLVAAFMPMIVVPTILLPLSHELPGRWFVVSAALCIEIVGVVCTFVYGLRTYPFVIGDSSIRVHRTTFIGSEIQSIRIRNAMVYIFTPTWRKRAAVTFNKEDIGRITELLTHFANQHGIPLSIQ